MAAVILGIDHIGIAVESLRRAGAFYAAGLGLGISHQEDLPDRGLKVAFIPVGGLELELLEPTDPNSPVAKFLAKRGPGIHHVALRVDNIEAALHQLESRGVELLDKTPRPGAQGKRIAFLSPRSTGGVLIELCQVNTAG